MPFNQELESLPHGPAFRFVSELLDLVPGQYATAAYTITGSEAFLEGHFPGNPIWPGVIMIEAIAQLAGVVAQSDPDHPKLADLRLTSVKNAKILGTATPGSTLTITASVEGRMGNLVQAKGAVAVGDTTIANAVVMLSGG
jgi:3-hydroxyacyl-[acyl-carrier-protein] dehydratase